MVRSDDLQCPKAEIVSAPTMRIEMDSKWRNRFMAIAKEIASWSKDPSTKVGCVIIDGNKKVVSMGYNGFPRGVNDSSDLYADREAKYLKVVHAEINAIISAKTDLSGMTAVVTHEPCSNCMAALIQAGIGSIVTQPTPSALRERFKLSFEQSDRMRADVGLEMEVLDK